MATRRRRGRYGSEDEDEDEDEGEGESESEEEFEISSDDDDDSAEADEGDDEEDGEEEEGGDREEDVSEEGERGGGGGEAHSLRPTPSDSERKSQNVADLVRCFFFGDVCAKKDPKAHLNYICTLYDYFLINYHQFEEIGNPGNAPMLPLVVNTSWVKGSGYVTLVEMLRHMSPTHVVQIRVSPESKNLPSRKFWSDGNENTPVNQIGICGTDNDSSVRSQCLPRDFKISSYIELCRCLASIAPIGLPLSSIKVVRLHYQVPSNMIYESLIGSIVGLAVSSLFPNSSRCCTPRCLGLGIVRAVDNLEDRIYVTTPVSRHLLERVDLVFQGSVEVPTCLLQFLPGASASAKVVQLVTASRKLRQLTKAYHA